MLPKVSEKNLPKCSASEMRLTFIIMNRILILPKKIIRNGLLVCRKISGLQKVKLVTQHV